MNDVSSLQTCTEDVVKDMVGQTSGFMPRDIRALVADAGSSLIPINGSSFEKLGDSKEFMVKALERSKKRNASALGTPKVCKIKNGCVAKINTKFELFVCVCV